MARHQLAENRRTDGIGASFLWPCECALGAAEEEVSGVLACRKSKANLRVLNVIINTLRSSNIRIVRKMQDRLSI